MVDRYRWIPRGAEAARDVLDPRARARPRAPLNAAARECWQGARLCGNHIELAGATASGGGTCASPDHHAHAALSQRSAATTCGPPNPGAPGRKHRPPARGSNSEIPGPARDAPHDGSSMSSRSRAIGVGRARRLMQQGRHGPPAERIGHGRVRAEARLTLTRAVPDGDRRLSARRCLVST
jgi:hypothetical protein